LFDGALADGTPDLAGEPADGIGAFAGPPFDPNDLTGYLAAWRRGAKR
jgi:NitT/TauT family transport system ATP-binding protein